MPQLDFYLDEGDKIELMALVFSEGGYIVPALQYEKPMYIEIRSVEEYKSYANRSLLLFIVHDSFFREPLTFDSISKEGKELFYIPQRVGGPTIDFYSPGKIDKEGTPFIGQGNVSYYTSYRNSQTKQDVAAPEAQKDFYKRLVKKVKDGFAIKLSKRTYWVGSKTLNSLKNGSKLMNVGEDLLTEFMDFAQVT